jgi:hypothetical protein
MEPLSSILLSALGKISNTVVADAYQAIKNYLTNKLGNSNKVNQAIENLEKESTVENKQRLDHAVTESKLQQDIDFQALLNALSEKTATANIQVNISDNAKVQGVVGSTKISIGQMNFSND